MKTAAFAVVLLVAATPAFAQFGKLGDLAGKAGKLATEMNISEQEERELGERVSATVRTEFGVVQNAAVTSVSLLGNLLAKASSASRAEMGIHRARYRGCERVCRAGNVHITRGRSA